MIPLNPLYEVVPVGKVPGNTGLFIALRNEGSWQELWWDGFKWKQYEFGKNYDDVTHYLRPLPPERMEEMIKNAVYIALNLSGEGYVDREYIAKKTLEKITL